MPVLEKDIEQIAVTDWTLEFSFRPDSVEGTQCLISNDGDAAVGDLGGSWVDITIVDGSLCASAIDSRGQRVTIESSEPVLAEAWLSVALVFRGTHFDLYTCSPSKGEYQHLGRGELEGGLIQPELRNPTDPPTFWSLGRGRSGNIFAFPYAGYIDEVRFTALSLTEEDFLFSGNN